MIISKLPEHNAPDENEDVKEMMTYIIINMWPNEIRNDGDIKFINVNPSPDEINAFNHLLNKCIGFHRYEGTGMSLDYYIKNIYPTKEEFTTNCVLN